MYKSSIQALRIVVGDIFLILHPGKYKNFIRVINSLSLNIFHNLKISGLELEL